MVAVVGSNRSDGLCVCGFVDGLMVCVCVRGFVDGFCLCLCVCVWLCVCGDGFG